jgi:hypothetical protein
VAVPGGSSYLRDYRVFRVSQNMQRLREHNGPPGITPEAPNEKKGDTGLFTRICYFFVGGVVGGVLYFKFGAHYPAGKTPWLLICTGFACGLVGCNFITL